MSSPFSFKALFAHSVLIIAPNLAAAQEIPLQSCLTSAGVRSIISSDSTWSTETTPWQLRLTANPSAVAYPETQDQVASSLSCARTASVKVSALGGGHSFVAYGFGSDGNLVINMAAFQNMSYDPTTELFNYGGGVRVGTGAAYLWEEAGRHFPHVRHGRPGLAGSSIGGGFGTTSRLLGTPMDFLESVEYMLYDGTVVKAEKGSDLFWAAQGAGSSYGILLALTTRTWKPIHQNAINFTLSLGNVNIDVGTKALLAIQEYALNEAPDEFAIRWSLTAAPFSGTGYYYGDPATFDSALKPLMDRLPANATLTKSEFDFWTMETLANPGLNLTNGGTSAGRSFYIQALTTTTDHPLTYDLAYTLFESTTFAFNRTDIRKSGFLDLWGGVSRDVSDSDTAFAHGKNLWLIRWEANAVNASAPYPADAVQYLKNQMLPFEQGLVASGASLRGFANYRDSALTEAEWSQRLYGKENFARLKQIKATVDPEGLFTANAQSIPLSGGI